jgi:hypothetical protein
LIISTNDWKIRLIFCETARRCRFIQIRRHVRWIPSTTIQEFLTLGHFRPRFWTFDELVCLWFCCVFDFIATSSQQVA